MFAHAGSARRLGALVLLAICAQTLPAAAAAPLERIVDVVEISWSGAKASVSATEVADTLKTDTFPLWAKITDGQVVFTPGATVSSPLSMNAPLPCDSSPSIDYMSAVRKATYAALGTKDSDSHYLVILSPTATPARCIWDGRGLLGDVAKPGGTLILQNTTNPEVLAHELGHNLGLGHSSLETCKNGASDGSWGNCTAVEYGSATDLMSNNRRTSPLAAYHMWRLGLISNDDIARPRTTTSVVLQPISATSGTRALFMRDDTATYWVEFRQEDAVNGIKAGLVVYRTDPPPGSAVVSPIAADATDYIGEGLTTDIWMINLGDYKYTPWVSGSGSPSLAEGVQFKTAFGGASIAAHANADGTATVAVTINPLSVSLQAPKLTPATSWMYPDAPLIDVTTIDDRMGISRYEARVTSSDGEQIVALAAEPTKYWSPTYLNPFNAPLVVTQQALPEGNYEFAIRAVDAQGTAGPWSNSTKIQVDRGAPVVSSDFEIVNVQPNKPVAVNWVGAQDLGSGICKADTVNADGFAMLRWESPLSGTPSFVIASGARIDEQAQAFDCLGNGVEGRLTAASTYVPAGKWKSTGTWVASGDAKLCKAGKTCTATFTSSANGAVFMRQGGATLTVDGRRVKSIANTSSAALRKVYTFTAGHAISLSGKGFALVGAQQLSMQWKQTGEVQRVARATDPSLTDGVQVELSKIGFSQSDFQDSQTVLPLGGGTTVEQGTLDLCTGPYESEKLRVNRRQVVVTYKDNPYQFLSTETVRYKDAAAVQQALSELDSVTGKCKASGYDVDAAGTKEPYVFHELPALPDGLRPASDRRIYYVTIGTGASARDLLVAYQFKNNMLNGMYVAKAGANSLTTADIARWLDVAAVLAGRM